MNRELSIGRTPENDILIPDTSVSREHASLIISGNSFAVRDNNSSNGTFINGRRVTGLAQLESNDILKVGNSLVPWMNYLNVDKEDNKTEIIDATQTKKVVLEVAPQIQKTEVRNQATESSINVPNSRGALTCGILGVIFSPLGIFGIIGLVLSIIALALGASGASAYKRNPSKYREGSLKNANAGKVLGIIGLSIFSALIILFFLVLNIR